jgi:hypothetical protein
LAVLREHLLAEVVAAHLFAEDGVRFVAGVAQLLGGVA